MLGGWGAAEKLSREEQVSEEEVERTFTEEAPVKGILIMIDLVFLGTI